MNVDDVNGLLLDVSKAVARADVGNAAFIIYCGRCTRREPLGWIVGCPELEGLLLVAVGPSLFFDSDGTELTPSEIRKATGTRPPAARRGAMLTGPNRLAVRFPDLVPTLEQSTRVWCPRHGEFDVPVPTSRRPRSVIVGA